MKNRQDFLKIIQSKKNKPLITDDDIYHFIAKKDKSAFKRFMEGDDPEGNNLYDWMIFAEDGTQLGFPIDADGMAPTYNTSGVWQTLKDMKKVAFILHRSFGFDLSIQLIADVTGIPVLAGKSYGSQFLVVNPGDDLYKRVEFIRTTPPGRTENGSIMIPFVVDIKSKEWKKGFEEIIAPSFLGLPKKDLGDNAKYQYKKSVLYGTGGTRYRMDPTVWELLGMLADKNPKKVLQIFNYYKDWFEKDKTRQAEKFLEMIEDLKAGKKRKKTTQRYYNYSQCLARYNIHETSPSHNKAEKSRDAKWIYVNKRNERIILGSHKHYKYPLDTMDVSVALLYLLQKYDTEHRLISPQKLSGCKIELPIQKNLLKGRYKIFLNIEDKDAIDKEPFDVDEENMQEAQRLFKNYLKVTDEKPQRNKKQQKQQTHQQIVLKGKNIVVTGTIEGMTRDQVAKKIKDLGGTIQSGVTKETDVVIKAQKPGKAKLQKAKQYGIPIVLFQTVSHRF